MEKISLFVPGRLCLFGEHSDWAGRYQDVNAAIVPGLAIVTGIDLGIYATAQRCDGFFKMQSLDANGKIVRYQCPMDLAHFQAAAQQEHYFAYVCGVAAQVMQHYQVGGLSLTVTKMTLPIKKGLSSSAAVCVLVARAFNEVYHLNLSHYEIMQIAYQGELLTKSRCGRLDQACAYGVHPVCMQFAGDQVTVTPLLIGQDLPLVFADLGAKKDTRKILAALHQAYPFAQTAAAQKLHTVLGEENRILVHKAITALASGDLASVGALMTQAQIAFDANVAPFCPEELTAPRLHQILSDPQVQTLTYGGKGVGSGGDGSVQFVAKDAVAQQALVQYLQTTLHLDAHACTIQKTQPINTAVIPLAGFGTRMYPETRFVKKEFLPLVDRNGWVKPVLLHQLEELDAAGMQTIILVIAPDELPLYQKMLQTPLSREHFQKLPPAMQTYERRLLQIGKKIKFIFQKERRGFGDAVYQALPLIGSQPVLLCLGDFVYRSHTARSCTQQLMDAYALSGGQTTVAIKEIALDAVVNYGILAGEFDAHQHLMTVKTMIEKPTVRQAQDYLAVSVNGQARYYATFGQYVLTPDVFTALAADLRQHQKNNDATEIQLTTALNTVLAKQNLTGVVIDGDSFDVGMPQPYLQAIQDFARD